MKGKQSGAAERRREMQALEARAVDAERKLINAESKIEQLSQKLSEGQAAWAIERRSMQQRINDASSPRVEALEAELLQAQDNVEDFPKLFGELVGVSQKMQAALYRAYRRLGMNHTDAHDAALLSGGDLIDTLSVTNKLAKANTKVETETSASKTTRNKGLEMIEAQWKGTQSRQLRDEIILESANEDEKSPAALLGRAEL